MAGLGEVRGKIMVYPPQGYAPVVSGGDFLPPDTSSDLGSVAFPWAEAHVTTLVFGGAVTGSLNPSADETYSLGETSTPLRWNAGYFGAGGIFVENTGGDAWVKIDSGDDAVAGNKGITFQAAADEDIELINLPGTTGTPRAFWDESSDAWSFSNSLIVAATSIHGTGEGGTTAATGTTIRAPSIATGGAGNVAGADLTITPGAGTGTGDAGQIIFRTYQVAAAGDNLQTTLETILTLDEDLATFAKNVLFTGSVEYGALNTVQDDVPFVWGTGADFVQRYERADANAFMIVAALPGTGTDAQNVSVFALVDYAADGTDLGAGGIDLSGTVEPTLVVGNAASDAWASFDAGDVNGTSAKGLYFKAAGDEDINVLTLSVTGTPTWIWDESETAFSIAGAGLSIASANALILGVAGASTGLLEIDGATSGTVQVTVAAAAGTWTMTLPPDNGDAGEQLQTNGAGVTTWEAAGSLRAFKDIHRPLDRNEALDAILGTTPYQFNYRQESIDGQRLTTTGDFDTEYAGVMGDDAPWAMHHGGRIFSPVSAFGYTVAAFHAVDLRVAELEETMNDIQAELAALRG